jgi:hypothetical protein
VAFARLSGQPAQGHDHGSGKDQLARAVWTSDVWFFTYTAFWLWVATFSVRAARSER